MSGILNVSFVSELPTPLVPTTVYLLEKAAGELQIVAVGNTVADVRSTVVKGDVNTAVTNAIAALDLSNSAQYAATIAARDALALTKSSFVVVGNAVGDITVKSGSAMYFYNKADDSWTKVAEYESMDLEIPNKAILEKFSDVNGQLLYDGKPLGTVVLAETQW